MKKELDEKKWKNFELILQIVWILGAFAIGNKITEFFKWDSFIAGLLVYIVIIIVLAPLQAVLKSVVENHPALRKFFEVK